MAARTLPTNATPSQFGSPMVGAKNKTVTVSGAYNAQQSSAATTDAVQVYADYGIWDSTTSQNLDSNSTNFKDPA